MVNLVLVIMTWFIYRYQKFCFIAQSPMFQWCSIKLFPLLESGFKWISLTPVTTEIAIICGSRVQTPLTHLTMNCITFPYNLGIKVKSSNVWSYPLTDVYHTNEGSVGSPKYTFRTHIFTPDPPARLRHVMTLQVNKSSICATYYTSQ